MPDDVPQGGGLIYQHHYDRDTEAAIEGSLMNLIMWIQEWNTRNTYIIKNPTTGDDENYIRPIIHPEAIAELRKVYSQANLLFMSYQEWETAEKIKEYITWLSKQKTLDPEPALQSLELLSEMIAKKLKIKHKFRDRIEDKQPWDRTFFNRLEFPAVWDKTDWDYYQTITAKWKKLCFLICYYVVRCNGDAHILLSGPNLSGKSNTAIRMLKQCNFYLVEYFKVKKYNDLYIEKRPEAANIMQDKFSIKRDVYVTPDPTELKNRFESQQYQTIDINESMEVATNLQSMKSDIVSLGVKRYTSRSYHNIVFWEYQVQQRPTAMMLEGFNMWLQKMRKRHMILSLASTLVRKKDPYYMAELNKCRTDKEIGIWMRRINPNFIAVFRAPKLGPNAEKAFQMHYWNQKDLASQSDKVRTKVGQGYNLMIENIWNEVNTEHTLSFIEIGDRLDDIGFNNKDKQSFLRDYGKYNRLKQYENWSKKTVVGEIKE